MTRRSSWLTHGRYRPRLKRSIATAKLGLEPLEPRQMLAIVSWINPAGGDWNVAANWQDDVGANRLPGPGDDAVIPAGGGMVVHATTATEQLNSLSAASPVRLSAGVLDISGTLGSTSAFILAGGTLRNADITAGTNLSTAAGTSTLDGVTVGVGSNVVIASNDGFAHRVNVVNGLAIEGGVRVNEGGALLATGTQTFAGAGEVVLDGFNPAPFLLEQPNMTLTIGPDLTVRGGLGGIQNGPGGSNTTLVNQGTIRSNSNNANGGGLVVATTHFVNAGGLEVTTGGAALNINTSTWRNQSPIEVFAGTLNINATSWSNESQIGLSGGTLNLGGNFARSSLGSFTRAGGTAGTINLKGTLDNTNDTLLLNAGAGGWGTWVLAGGRITGGTVVTRNGAELLASSGPTSTLDGVTLAEGSDLVLATTDGAPQTVNVINGLVVDGKLTIGAIGRLLVTGSQTFDGHGEILFTDATAELLLNQSNMTLTLGSSLRVHGREGNIGNWLNFPTATNTTIVNQGTVQNDFFGINGGITIGGPFGHFTNGPNWINTGSLRARPGSTLRLQTPVAIDGFGVLDTQVGGALVVHRDLTGTTTNADLFRPRGLVQIDGQGNPGTPRLLEAMSRDLGNVAAGFDDNFAFGPLALTNGATARLVDNSNNAPGVGSEVVYAQSLSVAAGSTLDLNGLALYTRAAQINGSVVGGTVTIVPDGGDLLLGIPTPGAISASGQLDTWTFFGRSGQSVRTVVSSGAGSSTLPFEPSLSHVQVQIVHPNGTVLDTATASGGGDAVLAGVNLPVDGVYEIRIQAAPSQPSSTGNYIVTAWDATVTTNPLVLNQTTHGQLASVHAVDQWTFAAAANQQVRLERLGGDPGLLFDLTGPGGFVGFTGLTTSSGLVTLTASGVYTLKVRSMQGADGGYAFRMNQTSETLLALGASYNGVVAGTGFAQLFRVNVPSFQPLLIQFDGQTNTDRIEVYASHGSPPTRQDFDVKNETVGADHRVGVPGAVPGTWYILVYGDALLSPSTFVLSVDATTIEVLDVSPQSLANSSAETLTIEGVGFLPGTIIELLSQSGGVAIAAQQVSVDSTRQVSAVFDLSGATPGAYDVRAILPTGPSSTLVGSLSVTTSGSPHLETQLLLPGQLGRHIPTTLYVEYANTGTARMPAPILILQSNDPDGSDRPLLGLDGSRVVPGTWTSAVPDKFADSVQIYAQGSTPGLLLPGERVRVPIYYVGLQQPWDFSDTEVEFGLLIHEANDPALVNWPSLSAELKPDSMDADAWAVVYANLQAQIGPTWGDYVQMLSDNAAYLERLGQRVGDVTQLYQFEIAQALVTSPVGTIAAAVDAFVPTTGLSLSFQRVFGNSVSPRYRLGPFGRGWEATIQATLEEQPDGTAIVHESADAQRRFQPDGRSANTYFSANGDTGRLRKVPGAGFELTELDGTLTRFHTDGRFDQVRDTSGNTITAGYTAAKITSLTHSSGGSLAFMYNAAGRITSITDSFGRVTSYTYDPANEHLLTVTDPSGTTTFTYSSGQGAAREHALTSIADSSGVTRFFDYDDRGRLIEMHVNGNLEQTTFDYGDEGQVTVTDSEGVTTELFFDGNGFLARTEDASGFYVRSSFDERLRLVRTEDAIGRRESYSWTPAGAFESITDALNQRTLFTPVGPLSLPQSFTDARGNITSYAYDAAGNLIATTYADATIERATYDAAGNADVITNRRGQTIDRTVNAAGQIMHETRSDGTFTNYTYDSRGRLSTATDASGTITLTYDLADRLTRVDYPGGRFLQYAYDAAGRRTQLRDHSGFETNYEYDSAGRLERLEDAAGALVIEYAYDAAGRLAREDKGNGTFTIYLYDAVGRTMSIVHHAPGGAVTSQFLYTYDAAGRRISQTTSDGTWTYSYDLTDQLIRALFDSTNPSITDQDLQYEYDALGNRTRTIVNGATTDYVANNMNQYTSAGATTFEYDLDGNLIREDGPGGLKEYTYDIASRLVRAETPQGVWDYEYDVLGNRKAVVKDGQRTEYLVDPSGLGDVAAEYDGAGSLLAHYTQGIGLASRIDSASSSFYYNMDAIGSTAELTSGSGSVVNQYGYRPFGEVFHSSGNAANPFTFVGREGVIDDGSELYFMRARFYTPDTGRFVGPDPIRLESGDINLYRYAENNPATEIDPSGLDVRDRDQCEGLGGYVTPGAPICTTKDDINVCAKRGGTYRLKPYDVCEEPCPDCGKPKLPPPPPPQPSPPLCILKPTFVNAVGSVALSAVGFAALNCGRRFIPPDPPGGPGPGGNGGVTGSIDPNEKLGAAGFGSEGFIAEDIAIPYRINFENLGPGTVPTPEQPATAPAQRVVVTDQLSANLDWSTFEFTEFGFGDEIVALENSSSYVFHSLPMSYNGQDFNVEVELSFDPITGMVRVVFQSVDPDTELPPDVLTGFLPPEDGTGRGKGYIAFRVQPLSGLPSGTELRNVAYIKFDVNDVIATNQIDPQDPSAGTSPDKEALNTIDAGLPTSSVDPLPGTTNTADFLVTWSGADDLGGSGIAHYDVFLSVDAGPFTLWQDDTTATSATYSGTFGHTYSFYSVAADNVGHVEAPPAVADASTQLQQFSATIVAIASDFPGGSVYGQSVTFTATVSTSPPAGTPTGTVQFQIDSSNFGSPLPLVGGAASISTSTLAAGTHAVTVIYVSDSSLFEDSSGGPLTQMVAPAPLVITADDQSKSYGAAMPTLTASYSGFVNGDDPGDLTTPPTLSTTATAASHVQAGGYPITASGAAADNYLISYVAGTLTITPVALVITADDKSKLYGAALPPLTASYSGFVNGDDEADLTTKPTLATTATASSHVVGSPYPITASGAISTDYTITYVDGELTVTPAPLTITAEDKSKLYGAALPALTATYAGFVNGDDPSDLATPPSLSTTATAASHVAGSPYTITAAGAASSDYTISYVAGQLLVTPAPLTITADDKTKLQGDPLPPLTVTYAGFVNGDDATNLTTPPSLSTTATAASAPGTYPIFVSGATSSDYVISHVNATLTVTSAAPEPQNTAFLAPDPLDPTKTTLFVYGTGSHDQILLTRGPTAADVTVRINGALQGTFRPTGSIVAHGLAGNDLISVAQNVSRRAWLYGDDGSDALVGGGGASILFGGNGNDALTSGVGRAILIGGAASDLLTSGAGAAVMIGGSTDYDANDEALLAVLNEWSSSGSYTNRVKHLTGQPGGLNGMLFLNSSSIDNDGFPDVYLSINSRDLIFKSLGDVLAGQSPGETVVVV